MTSVFENQDLFLDKPVEFDNLEKAGGMLTQMGDNADMWEQEVLDEAYNQLPFLSEFDIHVATDKKDEERGYGMGSIDVTPKTMMTTQEMEERPLQKVQVPFVIRERMMAPLDIYIENGKYRHLTEGRLRSSLHRNEIFDSVRDRPTEPSLYNDLQPPLEASTGFGVGGAKLGAAKEKLAELMPLLPQLHGRVRQDHIDRVKTAMADPSIIAAYANAPQGVQAAALSAFQMTPSDPQKTAELVRAAIPPTVVQFKNEDGHHFMKWANADMYSPSEQEITPEMFQQLMQNLEHVPRLESDGFITASPDMAQKQTLEADEVRQVDQPGIWHVQTTTGQQLTGWCFPQLLSFNMQPLPLVLFNNGSQHAVQDSVAGRLVGKSADLPRGRMQGYGCLYYVDHGTPRVFVPMTILGTFRGPDGSVNYTVECDTGERVTLIFSEGLRTVVQTGPTEYCVPSWFDGWWMALTGKVDLVPQPDTFTKTANESWTNTGELIGDGTLYSWRGPPFGKIAASHCQFLRPEEAEFVGVAAGLHPETVKEAMKKADIGQAVEIQGMMVLGNPEDAIREAHEKVAAAIESLPRPIGNYDFIKEAAFLEDAQTADKILGLGFLNAENVNTFVEMLPGLEEASSKIAEMLMASRVGMRQIPEVALERVLIALDDVIDSLRALKQKELSLVEA